MCTIQPGHRIGVENNDEYEKQTVDNNPRLQEELRRAQNSSLSANTDPILTLLADVINVTANKVAPDFLKEVLHALANASDPLHGIPDHVTDNKTQRPWLPFVDLSLVDDPTQPQYIEDIGALGDMYEALGVFQAMANAVYLLSDQLPTSSVLTNLLPLLSESNSTAL